MERIVKNNNLVRYFEIPYNFDLKYLNALEALKMNTNPCIQYIYVAPYIEDYTTVIRHDVNGSFDLTREQYVEHINAIRKLFDGKMQLLLQKPNQVMPIEQVKWYIDLGFTVFCCGGKEQAKIIKEYDKNLTTIASILAHTNCKKFSEDPEYEKYFDSYVLDFSFCKNIQEIKMLPDDKKYMILVNALCNAYCDGDRHWYAKSQFQPINCPGKLGDPGVPFEDSVLIRPMDLKYFDPYIETYKLGDRSWKTSDIIRDIVLYTTDYDIYPGIEYDELLYESAM